jgi:proline iminopeptidase
MQKKTIIALVLFVCWLAQACDHPQGVELEWMQELNGTDIFIKTIGKGEPIIVIHGGPGLSHDYFLPHFNSLAADHLLIFYDQRGAGRSSVDQNADNMNLDTFTEDLEALRKALKMDRIHLLSHSWGALIASSYATHYPEHVASLIYVTPVPVSQSFTAQLSDKQAQRLDSAFISARQQILDSDQFKSGSLSAYEQLFKLSFSLTFQDKSQADLLQLNLNKNFTTSQNLLKNFTGLEAYDYLRLLTKNEFKSLVIHGKNDLSLLEADKQLAEAMDGKLEIMETGHFPFIEKPNEFTRLIRNFISRTP